MTKDDISQFNTREYWDKRYEDDTKAFDWFADYSKVQVILQREISDKSSRILMLGCGNSTLSRDMFLDGYESIVNIDYSGVVIEQMKQLSLEYDPERKMEWLEADIRNMKKIQSESVDICIDKGTMDALMCEKGDVWNPSQELINNVKGEVDEVMRVLRPQGKFIYITFGQPHFRKRHLLRDCWDFRYETIGEAFHYFVYVMTKRT